MPPKPASLAPSPLFKFRRIKHLVVAAITEFVVPRAAPLDERIRKDGSLTGDRGFESFSLHQRDGMGQAAKEMAPSSLAKN